MQGQRQFIDIPDTGGEGSGWKSRLGNGLAFCVAVGLVTYWGYHYYIDKYRPFDDRLVYKVVDHDDSEPKKPYLPDISGFTVGMIAAKVPSYQKGQVAFARMEDYPEFSKFMEGDVPKRLRLLQRRVYPRGLVVKSGHYDWAHFYNEVHAFDPDGKLIRKEGDVYTLRAPLLVAPGASLSIDAGKLRLSKQANAYLLNAGDMFIMRTAVIGWDEEKNAPTKYTGDKHDYRPFVTTWGGGGLYIAGSHFESLGYLKGKSYGISYSTCVKCLKDHPDIPPPTGVVVGSSFTDMYYGFYSYEAEDVAIVGNTYYDNVIYAIDPHDRSRRLIIAGNETYGTHKKHGIIVSREVNDSWIFNNYTHHNHGSGIMIDRTSVNNVIADNVSEHNEQDGITLFESEHTTTWGNKISHNKRSGIRIRNSWNVHLYHDEILNNDGVAVEVYVADITGQETRDFELDPYTQRADAYIEGAKISSSGSALFKMQGPVDKMSFSNIDLRMGTHLFPVSYVYDETGMLGAMSDPVKVLDVRMKTAPGAFWD
ncbi:MAG: right-handed parallel beta-helix repeat-containing protein [Alphaproteobacteria bacterium]|nr:right-handed parallel beta-helix repeat-containing protein [Alphaproteobacteria bacterium]